MKGLGVALALSAFGLTGCLSDLVCKNTLAERTLELNCSDGPRYECSGTLTAVVSGRDTSEVTWRLRTTCPYEVSGVIAPKDSYGGGGGSGLPSTSGPTPQLNVSLSSELFSQLLSGDLVDLVGKSLDLGRISRTLLALVMVGPELLFELGEVVRDTSGVELPETGECTLRGTWWLICQTPRGERLDTVNGLSCKDFVKSQGVTLGLIDAKDWCQ